MLAFRNDRLLNEAHVSPKASLINLTTHFNGLAQLKYKNNNLRSNKNLDYSHIQILVISPPTLDS